jgi:hypothetical protein
MVTDARETRCRTARTIVGGSGGHRIPQRLQARVEQVARDDVAERGDHRRLDVGVFDLELGDESLDALALQAEVAAGRAAAADDGQARLLGVGARPASVT